MIGRFLASLLLLLGLAAPSFGAAVLNQMFVAEGDSTISVTSLGNSWKFTPPVQEGNGNCLVLAITYVDGTPPTGIVGTNSGTWSTTAVVTATNTGSNDTGIYLRQAPSSGTDTITITMGATSQPVFWTFEEWSGVTCSSNGTQNTVGQLGTALTVGSFTPTNNNGNGGNLILAFFSFADGGTAGTTPTNWVAGSAASCTGGAFTLLDADIAYTAGGLPRASEQCVQATSGAINPGATNTGDTVDHYNNVAVALGLSSGTGTAPGNSIRIVKFIEQFDSNVATAAWKMQFPTTGNLRIVETSAFNCPASLTSVTDSDSNTYTIEAPDTNPVVAFAANQSPNSALTVTVTCNAAPNTQMHAALLDVVNAATSPLGAIGHTTGVLNSNGTLTDQPDITPQSTNSLIVALVSEGNGPCFSNTSPSGALFTSVTYTNQGDGSNFTSGDCWAILYNASTSLKAWNWTKMVSANDTIGALAVEFKSAPVGTCPPPSLALLGVGC